MEKLKNSKKGTPTKKSTKKGKKLSTAEMKLFLDEKAEQYNHAGFIVDDPIGIPHRYSKKQDIEIAGLFAAILAWGQRKTIINKCSDLLERMDNDPHNFITHHKARDLKAFADFKHRTFNGTDTLYFIHFLKHHYSRYASLESLFEISNDEITIEKGLINFHNAFIGLPDFPLRTKKHVATPERKSTCKRLSMYLRWMVRNDKRGVDFGIWKNIRPSQLICPCDVHVERVARSLGLLTRKQTDWQTALELTGNLRLIDPIDPVRYDLALFGLGIEGWGK